MGEPEDARDEAAGRPAQGQLPARPAAAPQVGDRPGGRVRRHAARRRGVLHARGGLRRRGRSAGCPATIPGDGRLPHPDRPLDPGRRGVGTAHADLLRRSTRRPRCSRPTPLSQGRRGAERSPRSTRTWSTRSRPAWPGTRTASRASRRGSPRTSRPSSRCPAATSTTATSTGPGRPTAPASTPRPSVGRPDRPRVGAPVRLRRPPRRRGLRHRRPQRRAGRARRCVATLRRFRPPPAGNVGGRFTAPLAQLAEQLTLNQRVGGSSPSWRTKPQARGPITSL